MFQGLQVSPPEEEGPGILDLLAAVLLVLVVILLSAYLRLGLHKTILVATVRQGARSRKTTAPTYVCHGNKDIVGLLLIGCDVLSAHTRPEYHT